MTKKEKAIELRAVCSHLDTVMDDLSHVRNRLYEEMGCKAESKKLDTIIGKLYCLAGDLYGKANKKN